jgi:predicted Zn finger-like uncharacterized protein
MGIRVTCEECGAEFSVPDEARGKKVRCRKCGEGVRVGGGSVSQSPPPRRASAGKSGRKAKRGTKKQPAWIKGAILGFVIFAAVGGIGWTVWHFTQGESADTEGGSPDGLAAEGGSPNRQAALLGLPTGEPTFRGYYEQEIGIKKSVTELFAGITDPASATEARPKLREYNAQLRHLTTEMEAHVKSGRETRAEMQAANEELAHQAIFATGKSNDQFSRLKKDQALRGPLGDDFSDYSNALVGFDNVRTKYVGSGGIRVTQSDGTLKPRLDVADETGLTEYEKQALAEIEEDTEYPRESWVLVTLDMTEPLHQFTHVNKRLFEIARKNGRPKFLRKGSSVGYAPVPDLDQFIKEIDFGKIVTRDDARRRIVIEVDPDYIYLPQGLRPPR